MTLDLSQISRLGFGVSGPHGSHFFWKRQTIRLIREAIELGVTVFDTAPFYRDDLVGLQDSVAELRLGQAIRSSERERLVLTTKIGAKSLAKQDFSPQAIEDSLNASLQRLATDYVDVLFVQGVARYTWTDPQITRLENLVASGKVRAIGLSGRGCELDAAFDRDVFTTVMAPVHVSLMPDELERLKKLRDTGRIVFGIESLFGTGRPANPKLSYASLWYLARRLGRQMRPNNAPVLHALPDPPVSPEDAFKFALDDVQAHCVLTLTTKSAHLRANAQMAGLDAGHGGA